MARKDIKQKVNIEFIGHGLNELEKSLDKVGSKISGKQNLRNFEKIKNDILAMQTVIAESGGVVSEDLFKSFKQDFDSILRQFDKIRRSLVPELDKQSSAELSVLSDTIAKLESDLNNLKEARTASKRNIKFDEQNPYDESKWKVSGVFKENVFNQVVRESGLSSSLLSPTGRPTESMKTYEATITSINNILSQLGDKEEKIVNKLKNKVALNATEERLLTKVWENGKSRLTIEEAIEQLKYNDIIAEKTRLKNKEEIDSLLKTEQEIKETLAKLTEERRKEEEKIIEIAQQDSEIGNSTIEMTKTRLKVTKDVEKGIDEVNKKIEEAAVNEKVFGNEVKKSSGFVEQAAKSIISYALVFSTLKRMYREAIKTIRELDKSITNMVIVTTMSRKEALNLVPALQDIARETGFATTEVAKLTTEFLKQGRALADALELTQVAAKAARIAGISAQESVDYLTSAINGFGLAANDAMAVSDKFAALAASSATSYEELAKGLSKFASQAKIAGLSMDFALGLLAKGIDTTREAPESIGTALKTVLARMRELTDLGKTFEDGMDVNRVETALGQVGVKLRDANGQFRDMQTVITEIGMKWDTLNKNQQASVAVAMAGTRQQSRLLAIFQDFDKTLQYIQASEESAGETLSQHAAYMEGMEAAMAKLQTAWQEFINTIVDSEFIIDIVRGIGSAISAVANVLNWLGDTSKFVLAAVVASLGVYKAYTVVMGALGVVSAKQIALQIYNNKLTYEEAAAQYGAVKARIAHNIIKQQSIAIMAGENVALKISTISWWAKAKAVWATLWPIMAVVAGVSLLIVGITKLVKWIKEENKSLKEKTESYKLARHETQKTIKGFDDLINRYNELDKKVIKTDEDIEALRSLGAELEAIDGLEVVYTVRGEVDIEKTLENLEEERRKKYEEQRKLDEKMYEDFQKRSQKDSKEASKKISDLYDSFKFHIPENFTDENYKKYTTQAWEIRWEAFLASNPDAEDTLADLMIKEFEYLNNTSFTSKQSKILESYYKKLFSGETFMKIRTDDNALSMYHDQTLADLQILEKAFDDMEKAAEKGIDNLFTTYNNLNLNKEMQAVIDESNPFIKYLSNLFKDSPGTIDVFQGMPLTTDLIKQLGENLEEEGYDIGNVLKDVVAKYRELQKLNPDVDNQLLQSRAWALVASETDNAVVKAQLYGMASIKTTQEVSQALDTVQNKLKSMSEQQQKYLSGEMSNQEIYEFVENNAKLFGEEGVLEDFLAGRDITNKVLDSMSEAYISAQQRIQTINEELLGDLKESDREALIKEKNALILMTRYRGEVANITKNQYEANKALEAYNRLKELGVDVSEMELDLIKKSGEATAENIRRSQDNIENINDLIEEKFGEGLYTIVDGVVKLSEKAINDLEDPMLSELEHLTQQIQAELDNQAKAFQDQRDLEVKIEKEKADKKKKIYEDYFKQLDRLENKREREQSREDIVKQLQRLEGATDAVSRQKAKELQSELIEMDKKNSEDLRRQSREDFIASFDKQVEELEERWANAAQSFVEKMAEGGVTAAEAMLQALSENGLKLGSGDGYGKPLRNPKNAPDITNPESKASRTTYKTGGMIVQTYTPYADGGLIDYTGPAMVHGSRSRPEMVLNAEQTQMFFGLRDALKNLSNMGRGGGSSIQIDNITIQTESMNNNQDFKKAGNQLAEAFSAAISRRGFILNTKR